MTERIKCVVPHCRRTASKERFPTAEEIICGKHWRMIPREVRDVRAKLKRRSRKISRLMLRRKLREKPKIDVQLHSIDCLIHRRWVKNWEACKRAAVEAAGGI